MAYFTSFSKNMSKLPSDHWDREKTFPLDLLHKHPLMRIFGYVVATDEGAKNLALVNRKIHYLAIHGIENLDPKTFKPLCMRGVNRVQAAEAFLDYQKSIERLNNRAVASFRQEIVSATIEKLEKFLVSQLPSENLANFRKTLGRTNFQIETDKEPTYSEKLDYLIHLILTFQFIALDTTDDLTIISNIILINLKQIEKNFKAIYSSDSARNCVVARLNTYKEACTGVESSLKYGSKSISIRTYSIFNSPATSIPSSILQGSDITELDIFGLNLTILPASIMRLGQLSILKLQRNKLKWLPPEIGNLTNLAYLYLSENELQTLPPTIAGLKNLVRLDLKENKLQKLPPEFGQLPNLSFLDLSYNKLTELPTEFGHLQALKYLRLHNNTLTSLPSEFYGLLSLVELDLSKNEIETIASGIGKLTCLKELELDANSLTTLPNEIGDLPVLRKLDLSVNKLKSIPSSLGRLANLEALVLSKNRFSTVPIDLKNLQKLCCLMLRDLPNISQCPNLKRVLTHIRPNQLIIQDAQD